MRFLHKRYSTAPLIMTFLQEACSYPHYAHNNS